MEASVRTIPRFSPRREAPSCKNGGTLYHRTSSVLFYLVIDFELCMHTICSGGGEKCHVRLKKCGISRPTSFNSVTFNYFTIFSCAVRTLQYTLLSASPATVPVAIGERFLISKIQPRTCNKKALDNATLDSPASPGPTRHAR